MDLKKINNMSESLKYFRQKKGQWIWIYDFETRRGRKIELQVLLDKVNHSFRHENIRYFALEKERNQFKLNC
tara:strand:- start:3953 stop:4168 length:216 start_codon:yes stop_codon:yes gene_type:complete